MACDLPAGRKVCGFFGTGAEQGCSRCLKEFPGVVGSMDYSSFDRQNWIQRTNSEHRKAALDLLSKRTITDLRTSESASGCHYSILLKLPYFDASRMLIIDPMHNLFLGSAKRVVKHIWISKGIIPATSFEVIQQRVNLVTAPSGIGHIPHKIFSGFSSFTADQWKNWVLYYSLISLHDILSDEHLECWRHFVLACRTLYHKSLTTSQIALGNALLLQFCRMERIYGKESITPNMHMHCHLRSCIDDYGPLYGFWLFAFECYNGILGSTPNNSHSIEVQLMQLFVRDAEVVSMSLPGEFSSDLKPLFPKEVSDSASGSLRETLLPIARHTVTRTSESDHCKWALTSPGVTISLPKYSTKILLNEWQIDCLLKLYMELYQLPESRVCMTTTICKKYKSVTVNNILFGSSKSMSSASSVVLVKRDSSAIFAQLPRTGTITEHAAAAQIHYFFQHTMMVDTNPHMHLFASLP